MAWLARLLDTHILMGDVFGQQEARGWHGELHSLYIACSGCRFGLTSAGPPVWLVHLIGSVDIVAAGR